MFVPGPTGAITWLGQMGADTANGEYSKVAKDLAAAILIGAGLKGAQAGAKAVGRTLAGKGVNIPWLDAYDYSALRNEYLNRAAKRARIITPNKGWENLSNFDVYKDTFYNHPAVETTEIITEIPKHYTDTIGNIEDIHKLKMHPNSAIETGYVNFIDDTKPFRKDLKGEYDVYRDGTTYMNGHPTKQGVLRQDLSGNEFLQYPRNSGVRYYTGHIKTEGYTPTLVHIGYPNMSGTVINPKIDPMKRLDKNYLWWQRNNPFWSHGNFTTKINDIVPSESAIDISRDFPTRLTDAIDLSDPKLDIVQMEFNPLTKTFGRVKYHIPQSTISPQEAATTYHFDGRIPLSKPIREAERLGIPKALRSSPKALEDPYYWGYQQWNDRYNAAVESGNIQEGRRLYDLHEARNAPNTQVRGDHYHGTNNTEYNIMDSTKNPGRTVGAGEKTSNFFSDIDLANTYLIDAQGMGTWYQGPGRLIRARLNIKNPYIFDYEGAKFNGNGGTAKVYNYLTKTFKDFQNGQLKYFPSESDFIDSWRAQNKYLGKVVPGRDYTYSTSKVKPEIADLMDNIIDRNVYDGAIIKNINEIGSPVTDYVTFTPNQVKLSNIITYDNHGNMIPIVKRHNYHNPDMRYKQGGILKAQNGFLNTWQKAYNSKFGKGLRDFMFGKDRDLSDEEYFRETWI